METPVADNVNIGAWNHVLVQFNFGWQTDGSNFVKMWANGQAQASPGADINDQSAHFSNIGPSTLKFGPYHTRWNKQAKIDSDSAAGITDHTVFYDNIVVGDANETYTSMVEAAFPSWLCWNDQVGNSSPIPVSDTLATQSQGYGAFSVPWTTLTINDTFTGSISLENLTSSTTNLCTVFNDISNSEIDVTEVSGAGSCQFQYGLLDINGTSTSFATVSTEVKRSKNNRNGKGIGRNKNNLLSDRDNK